MSDTSDDARQVQYRVLRAMSPARKLALVEDANRTGRRLAMAGIAMRHPETTPAERVRRLMDLVLGEELAAQVYGPRDVDGRQ
ncbi:MAG TPA: hypothetical protein VFV75_21060 [Candidatus Polarisedimenticolaceae bacterium]|nr:hypothetical protein [Candidatus Polarisedimenticolaceae bacterium]